MAGRLAKLEGAISKQRTIKFPYYSISRDRLSERTVNPIALLTDNGLWYVVAEDLDDKRRKKFRVSRVRGDIRFATRRERDFRTPTDFDIDEYRGRPPWQIGDLVGEARIEVTGDTAWWVERSYGDTGRLDADVFVTEYSSIPLLAAWVLRQDGRALPLEPPDLRREVARALRAVHNAHSGEPERLAREKPAAVVDGAGERPAGPVTPERFAVLQALLAYLLARCGDEREAVIAADDIVDRFRIPAEELEDHLALLNLVNFGGGCYTVYAELTDGQVHVDKELYGETFRAAPRRTRSSASCPTGVCTRGTERVTASAASASTGCARRSCSRRRSPSAKASSRVGCAMHAPRASSTRRRSRAGLSNAARARSPTGQPWRTCRSAARNGSRARSSPSAATRWCSSPTICAATSATAQKSSRRSHSGLPTGKSALRAPEL